jgi:hypothetical protein
LCVSSSGLSSVSISGANEASSEIINIAFVVHQVLFLFSFNLYSFKSLLGQLIRVIDINDIFLLFVLLSLEVRAIAIHVGLSLVVIHLLLRHVSAIEDAAFFTTESR